MRSKDRLPELRLLAAGERVYHETVELLEEKVPSSAPGSAPGSAPSMTVSAAHADIDKIFLEVERMRSWIHEMNGNTQLMRRLHADPTFHNNKHLQEQLEGCIARTASAALRASEALRRFEETAASRAGAGRNDARARITRWQFAATRRLYADALDAHSAALHALRAERRLLLHEQLKLTNLTLTEEERETLLDSKDLSMFVDNVRAETAEARRALREAEVRHDELTRLERALQEVRDLFSQLAHLVASQQERVDSVEYYALQATEHVESGQHELLQGKVSHARARKKKTSLIICLAAGFCVVLLVLVLT